MSTLLEPRPDQIRRYYFLVRMFKKGRKYRDVERYTQADKMVEAGRMDDERRAARLGCDIASHTPIDGDVRREPLIQWVSESAKEARERVMMAAAKKKDALDDAKTAQIIRDVYRTCGDVKIDQVAKEFGHRCRAVFAKMVEAGEIVNSEKGWVVK